MERSDTMKIKKKTGLLASALIASVMLVSGCGQAKIGYIDIVRVVDEAPQMKTAMEDANQKMIDMQQEIENELAAKGDELTEEDYEAAQRKLVSINQVYMTQMKQKLDAASAEVVKEKELDVIMETAPEQKAVFYGGIDVTDDIIQKLQ